MPSPETILKGLAATANDWRWLAIGWHVWLAVLAGLLVSGWRLSLRMAMRLLIAPLVSVAVLAWHAGNPFNAIVFAGLAGALARESLGVAGVPIRLASPAWIARGVALVVFGAAYPHFVQTDTPAAYLVASPFGLLPCPTLMVVLGSTLVFSNLPAWRWGGPLLLAGVMYAAIGVFRLGVALDWGLFIAATLVGARLMEEGRPWRSVRAFSFERVRPLPGDDLIPEPLATLTHAVTIHRRPQDVWPWLAQMGAGSRAGWYGYGARDAFKVVAITPGRTLVLGWSIDGGPVVTWAFVIEPKGGDATRLITRVRGSQAYRFHHLPRAWSKRAVTVVHFLMQRRQLLGIAERAESPAAMAVDSSVLSAREGHRV